MLKKLLCLMMALTMLPLIGTGEGTALSITAPEGTVTPWETVVIRYTVPEDGTVDVVLHDENGEEVGVVARGVYARAGENTLYWNGTYEHEAAPEGEWILCLQMNGGETETTIVIGAPQAIEDATEDMDPKETENPTEEISDEPEEHETEEQTGDEAETEEEHVILEDAEGDDNAEELAEEEEEPATTGKVYTPAETSPYNGQDMSLNYWTMPMDITDEQTVWKVLTAPITVIDNGKGEKAQIILRSEPDENSDGVGSITCMTQGVHVLERGDEWSLVECYSSSFHDSAILNWNVLAHGYVKTKYLKEITPNQEMGIVIDKLTQRLYLFKEGHLYSTLIVSTGISNERQPYNETRSGEFLLTSKVGTFASDNLRCGMAIRFNRGDLLHEVPYLVMADGTKDYRNCEAKLGIKASHGCIRVQRKKTPEGVNMGWIWNNHKKNTRLLIWEDWQGRQIEIPSDDTLLYYNPNKGQYYHSQETCESTRAGVVFTSFTYGELDEEPYSKLTRCEYCAPVLRKAEIEAINETYAEGGDHDPVLTEARKDCPKSNR